MYSLFEKCCELCKVENEDTMFDELGRELCFDCFFELQIEENEFEPVEEYDYFDDDWLG